MSFSRRRNPSRRTEGLIRVREEQKDMVTLTTLAFTNQSPSNNTECTAGVFSVFLACLSPKPESETLDPKPQILYPIP